MYHLKEKYRKINTILLISLLNYLKISERVEAIEAIRKRPQANC